MKINFFKSILLSIIIKKDVYSIGCYRCTSINHSNVACEDVYEPSINSPMYHPTCQTGRRNRAGLFPATHCIKIKAFDADDWNSSRSTFIFRGCELDNGDITLDTELIRVSHCGKLVLYQKNYNGCIQSCNTDGCNKSNEINKPNFVLFLIFVVLLVSFYN
ncbi:hypothetical protein SNEBB_007422 [Seison nebaliae]|nr:hypothetical protein SNEBB_007422 [Seison nebaliae]